MSDSWRNIKSKNPNRIIAGRIAKRRGSAFEDMLMTVGYRTGWEVLRIEDGCKKGFMGRSIPVSQLFDFIAVKTNQCLFFDAKSTSDKYFAYSEIDRLQLINLLKTESQGFTSGYIVYFILSDSVVFFSAKQLSLIKSKQSIKPEEGIHLGGLIIHDLSLLFVEENKIRTA